MLIGVDSQQGGYNSAVFALRLGAVSKRFIKWGLVPAEIAFCACCNC